jgi:hypothetical protein
LEDKRELLELLEQLEEQKPELVFDNRVSIEELFSAALNGAAQKSGNAEAYIEADRAHRAAIDRHTERLRKERPLPDGAGLPELQERYAEAVEAACADGHPPADELIKPPAPPKLEADPLERMKRATLPKATLRDVEDTQVRHAESVVYESIRAQQDAHFYRPVPEQRLNDFRGRTDAPLVPPPYSDS